MGMSGSQARLLSLTSRLSDVEFKAQSIEQRKIELATQEDELYEQYCKALDATVIKVAFRNDTGGLNYQNANFDTLCRFNDMRCQQYSLRDNTTGKLVVSQEEAEAWANFNDDKYSFAYAMLGYGSSFGWVNENAGQEIGIGTAQEDYGKGKASNGLYNLYMTEAEQNVYDSKKADYPELEELYNAIETATDDSAKKEALQKFRDTLYKKCDKEIFLEMNKDKSSTDPADLINPDIEWSDISREFNYYVNLWNAINEAGGCQAIDPRYECGDDGNTWLNNMVESGLVTILSWNERGEKGWSDTDVATSTNNNYLQKQSDNTDVKKAEAKYEHDLKVINRKDADYDTELSKLETERTSITTEMDAIKQVRDDNIDRTFGIFS